MKFRAWLQTIRLAEEEELNKLKHFIDMNGLVLFFKKGDSYFGAGEDSRVVFARLKNPDDEVSKGWGDEASFTAINLSKLVQGEPAQHVFSNQDIKKIKVIDREDVISALKDEAGKSGTPMRISALRIIRVGHGSIDRDDAPNFVRADEE